MDRRKFVGVGGAGVLGLVNGSALGAPAAAGSLVKPSFPDPIRGLRNTGGWTLAVLPDTQNYVKYAKNQANFDLMTRWLVENGEAWNLQAVLHEGDLVEQNDIATGGGRGYGDQNATSQWESARTSLARLDGVFPTIYATGNHDYGFRNSENRRTQFNNYFGLTDNSLICDGRGGGIWRESGRNSFGARTLENAAYELKAPGGRMLLVLSLEWGPRREAVAWANRVLAKEKYQNHCGILLTHDFLTPTSVRDNDDKRGGNPHTYKTGEGGNTHDGEELWQALVQPSKQIQLVLNGHEMGRHVGYRQDSAAGGQVVHQMLFNAQGLGGGSREKGNGGDGWMRFLTFEPDGETLTIRTFSPLLLAQNRDCWNRSSAWSFTVTLRGS